MTEAEARRVLLVRAFETPPAPPWSEADAAWASRETLQTLGEQAPPEPLLAERAALASARLIEREPAVATALRASAGWALPVWAVLLLALLAGLALDAAAGASGPRINILAPPFAALIAWSLFVYLALAVRALRGSTGAAAPAGPLRTGFTALSQALVRRLARRRKLPALAAYARDWAAEGRPLHALRVACLLHGGAAAIALGALASLYLRGLAFEYRAGWDSTFLSAQQVHGLLSVALWPALQLSGSALPSAEGLAALRFSAGGGENAARWIHLIAISVALFVLLPRTLLAAGAGWRAWRLAQRFPLALDAPYFQRLLRTHSGAGLAVQVLPYSYHLPPEAAQGLQRVLEHALGRGVELRLADATPWGGGDELDPAEPPPAAPALSPPDLRLPLFALSATPQRDTHGAFLDALRAQPGPRLCLVLIDESGLRRRYSAADAVRRLPQRRGTWSKLLGDLGLEPLFVDLAEPDLHAAGEPLQDALAAQAARRKEPREHRL